MGKSIFVCLSASTLVILFSFSRLLSSTCDDNVSLLSFASVVLYPPSFPNDVFRDIPPAGIGDSTSLKNRICVDIADVYMMRIYREQIFE